MSKERMPFHELANIFPLMTGAPFDAMVDDIREHGLREPIVKSKGKIVDGRNRYNACLKAKVEPYFVEWDEQGTLVSFIVSANLHRRHLDESQRAMVAAEIASLEQGQKKSDAQICASGEAVTQSEAAEMVNVSRRAVQQAAKVKHDAVPEVVAAVKGGDVSVNAAASIAALPKSKQADALLKEQLHKDVAAAWESGELTRSQCKKLSELRPMLQVDEFEKLRAAGKTKSAIKIEEPDDAEPEDETIDDIIKRKNHDLESFCRQIMKLVDEEMPADEWMDHLGRKDSARQKFKDACALVRAAKCAGRCPKCDGGCRKCHNTGRMPRFELDQLGAAK